MATIQDLMKKTYSGKYQQSNYDKMLKADLNQLVSAANKRIVNLRSIERRTGITPAILRVYEKQNLLTASGKFTSKNLNTSEEVLNQINSVKRFLNAKTSTVQGFKNVMIKDIKIRLGAKFGWSVNKSLKKISNTNIRDFWRTYEKLESSAKLRSGVYNFDSERIIKELWNNSFGTGGDIDFDEAMIKVENKLNEELKAYEEESKRKAAEITKYTGNIRY